MDWMTAATPRERRSRVHAFSSPEHPLLGAFVAERGQRDASLPRERVAAREQSPRVAALHEARGRAFEAELAAEIERSRFVIGLARGELAVGDGDEDLRTVAKAGAAQHDGGGDPDHVVVVAEQGPGAGDEGSGHGPVVVGVAELLGHAQRDVPNQHVVVPAGVHQGAYGLVVIAGHPGVGHHRLKSYRSGIVVERAPNRVGRLGRA